MLSVHLYSPNVILFVLLSSASLTGAQEVVTASRGETVVLPCSSPFEYSYKVNFKWSKAGETVPCNYYIEKNKTGSSNCKSRFKVNPEPFGLTITDVRSSDAGVYNCSITKVLPPPVEDKSSVIILEVSADLTVEQMNSSDLSCVDLLCSLEGLSPEQINFTWTRGSELLHHQNVPTSMNSSLHLCKPNWANGDTITCHADYSSTHTLYSQNITLTCSTKECSPNPEIPWLLIGSVVGACVGLLLLILLGIAFFKCRKKEDPTGSIVFSNKVYENLNFFTPRPNTAPGSTMNRRPNPQGECQTQREECIYEN
ncbi:uncharacterized protein LOC103035352 isoform X1 [Astyanax mexicanus]|uniref:uncharacterized protein LOC103035352 isoform X1 n=2 Tax=Astyanax mexicanus TaxID=7994 RepID=UPI0020CB5412|nr:uncharacterized protein LOC103035352 isoform X1 [Astyanax mexicanus]